MQATDYDSLRDQALHWGSEHVYFYISDKLSSTCYCYTCLFVREGDYNEVDFIVSDTDNGLVITLELSDKYRQNHNDRNDYERTIPHTEDMEKIINSVISLRFKRYYQEEPAE